jgi:5-methylcytosine-specific restriction endonuclease McrA
LYLVAREARRRSRKYSAAICDFTKQQWIALQEAFKHRCAYCGKRAKGKLTQDHIVPLSKGSNHTLSNIVPACLSCNQKKNNGKPIVPVQPLLLLAERRDVNAS